MVFLEVIIYAGFIISAVIMSGIVNTAARKLKKIPLTVLQGLFFGIIIAIDLLCPFIAPWGTHFDVREVILNISGIFLWTACRRYSIACSFCRTRMEGNAGHCCSFSKHCTYLRTDFRILHKDNKKTALA